MAESLIPKPEVIEARLAEIERERKELRALLRLALRIEAERTGGKAEATRDEAERDGALPFRE